MIRQRGQGKLIFVKETQACIYYTEKFSNLVIVRKICFWKSSGYLSFYECYGKFWIERLDKKIWKIRMDLFHPLKLLKSTECLLQFPKNQRYLMMANVFGQIVSKILKCFRHVSVVNIDLLFVAEHHVQKHSVYNEIGTVYWNIFTKIFHPSFTILS